MRQGVDYSGRAASWSTFANELRDAERQFAGRYLGADWPSGKGATARELEALWALGIPAFFFYEAGNDDALEGRETAKRHVEAALKSQRDLRIPESRPVYYAVDVDTTGPQVAAYFEQVKALVGIERTGAYGGYQVIRWLVDNGLISYGCQCSAWSLVLPGTDTKTFDTERGVLKLDARAQLHQHGPSGVVTIGGVKCDGVDAYDVDFGQYVPGQVLWHRDLRLRTPWMKDTDAGARRLPQIRLAQTLMGMPEHEIDGEHGPFTDGWTRSYQGRNGLKVDGWIGPTTWNQLLGFGR